MSGILPPLLLVLLLLPLHVAPARAQSDPADSPPLTDVAGQARFDFGTPAVIPPLPDERLWSPVARLHFDPPRSRSRGPTHPLLITAGASLGGAVGSLVGSQFQEDCETRCINARGALGPIVANTVLIPLGAHAFDRGRGDLLTSSLVSAGWGAAAVATAGLTDQTWPVWAALPAQVITSAIIEWHTARQRAR